MEATTWKQMNITYPGPEPQQRERQAVEHLSRVLPNAEADGHVLSWWFVRKGAWRVRYLLPTGSDPVRHLLAGRQPDGSAWIEDIYEAETHAFGGPAGMDVAHDLFHRDCRNLLGFLSGDAEHRRERSLLLCTALMRSAGLDLNEQGDVWARIADQRVGLLDQMPEPDPRAWEFFTGGIRQLLLGGARAEAFGTDWLAAYEETGNKLRTLREAGELTRGIRALIALHVMFHWNRIGLRARTQATLARAAREAVFGSV